MGREQRRLRRRHASSERRSQRLPCGCDAAELAELLGLSVDELLQASERADHADAGDQLVLVTLPLPQSRRSDGPGGGPQQNN